MKNIAVRIALLAAGVVLGVAPMAYAQIYTSDSNIAHFTSPICSFATFSNFSAGDVSSPFTPTASELATNGFRVFSGTLTGTGLSGSNWILASFSSPVSTIVVFPNIDHFGSAFDGYQYKIAGSNDGTNWTLLFDALTVNGAGEPFTLGESTGTRPSSVNNVLTPGAGPGGTVGYEAQFTFGTAYRYYAFGASTEAAGVGNTDQELSAVGTVGTSQGSCQRVTLNFTTTGPNTQTAEFLGPGGTGDPASHAMSLTTNVVTAFHVDLTAHYVPTEFSTGTTGAGIADGICEGSQNPPLNADDLDCGLAVGGFSYGPPPSPGNPTDQVVPHCSPYHNLMCVWYSVNTTAKATDEGGNDYMSPVTEKMGWNTNVSLAPPPPDPPNPEYPPGWNNQIERLYDRRGNPANNAFQFDITDSFELTCNINCVLPQDQAGAGHTQHFNDFVWADAPNPPGTADTFEPLVPVPGSSPFTYLSGLPMLVAFELEDESKEKSDPTALTKPHAVNVGTSGPITTTDPIGAYIPVQFPAGFPTTFTYVPFLRVYYIFLSPAPYKTDGTVYNLQIGSDLFLPVNVKFVVKKFGF